MARKIKQDKTQKTLPAKWVDGFCTNCGYDGSIWVKEFKYCPNCGKKMTGIIWE